MRPRFGFLPSGSTLIEKRTACGRCGRQPFKWDYTTNGDGSTVQQCPGCGTCYAVGRWWSDQDLGIRLPGSTWSVLVTLKPEPT